MSREMVALAEILIANGTLELLFAFSPIEIGRNLIFVMTSHVVNKIAGHSCWKRVRAPDKLAVFFFSYSQNEETYES